MTQTQTSVKTVFITGGSRGIGRAIALRFAREGANIVIAAKSDEPHPKLPGTIHSVAREVEELGGRALALKLDVRDDDAVEQAVSKAAKHFEGLDLVINNAGAIRLTSAETTPLKNFDLMHQINTRAVLALSQAALPWLKQSSHAHILNLSPPISLDPRWFKSYCPYTLTKYGMSMLTLGLSEEFRKYRIAVNSLWPRTVISTAAVSFAAGSEKALDHGRTPEIMSDAAFNILSRAPETFTGNFCIDEQILREAGVDDFSGYRHNREAGGKLMTDLFVEEVS